VFSAFSRNRDAAFRSIFAHGHGIEDSIAEYVVFVVPYNLAYHLYDPRWGMERRLADMFRAEVATGGAYPCLRGVYFIFVERHYPGMGGLDLDLAVEDIEQFSLCMWRTGLLRCFLQDQMEVEPILRVLEEQVGIVHQRCLECTRG